MSMIFVTATNHVYAQLMVVEISLDLPRKIICKYVCYYDPLNPCDYYICFDSLIVESNPIYNTIGYIKHISLGDNDVATITIRWKSDSGRWKWIEQAVSSTEVDRYKSCKKEGRPVTMVVYKTDGGHLAQAL